MVKIRMKMKWRAALSTRAKSQARKTPLVEEIAVKDSMMKRWATAKITKMVLEIYPRPPR